MESARASWGASWPRTVVWAGHHFCLRPLQESRAGPPGNDRAVWRGREFIGILPGSPSESTDALRARAYQWLALLYDA